MEKSTLYNKRLDDLKVHLDALESTGSHFCVDNFKPSTMPTVEVKKVAKIAEYPVDQETIKKMIAASIQAPYGKGTETLVDASVRNVWQLDAKQIRLSYLELTSILENIANSLGLTGEKLKANLYKLLIYEKGSFFKPHKDNEKEEKMIGTLVLTLPVEHKGGDLVIRHSGQENTISLENNDPKTIRYCAFYADCEHQVNEVTEGYRVCLVYNLCRTGKRALDESAAINVSSLVKSQPHLIQVEEIIKRELNIAQRIICVLEHSYTPAKFNIKKLKGRDLVLANIFVKIAPKVQCSVGLAVLEIDEQGSLYDDEARDSDVPKSNFGIKDSRVSFDPFFEIEMSEITEGYGNPYHIKPKVEENELFPKDSLTGTKPNKRLVTEITGNEGSEYSKLYKRAVIFIVKNQQPKQQQQKKSTPINSNTTTPAIPSADITLPSTTTTTTTTTSTTAASEPTNTTSSN